MAITGRKPKPDELKRNRVRPVHDWTEVADVPFEDAPPLLGRRGKAVLQWWAAVSSMPHCVLWGPSDWQYAFDTARIYSAVAGGKLGLDAELLKREKTLGTTADARRDLRIRYISTSTGEEPTGVTSLADYRAALSD